MIRVRHKKTSITGDILEKNGDVIRVRCANHSTITSKIRFFDILGGQPEHDATGSRRGPCENCILSEEPKNNPACRRCELRINHVRRNSGGMPSRPNEQIYHGNGPAEFMAYAGFMR